MNPLAIYLRELRDIRSSGANVPETSFYGPLANLLNDVGRTLKPRVRCIINAVNHHHTPESSFTITMAYTDTLLPLLRSVVKIAGTLSRTRSNSCGG